MIHTYLNDRIMQISSVKCREEVVRVIVQMVQIDMVPPYGQSIVPVDDPPGPKRHRVIPSHHHIIPNGKRVIADNPGLFSNCKSIITNQPIILSICIAVVTAYKVRPAMRRAITSKCQIVITAYGRLLLICLLLYLFDSAEDASDCGLHLSERDAFVFVFVK
jgi:hypothetical protein